METNNYLVDFLQKVDLLISEIDKLNSRMRQYRKNAEIFGFPVEYTYTISSEYFKKLRELLENRIEANANYDSKIVNLKRIFFRELPEITEKIDIGINQIEKNQEIQMNKLVNEKIYNAKISNEYHQIDMLNVRPDLFDGFLGINKYRKLASKNHNLKIKLLTKEFEKGNTERKTLFELVNMIEDIEEKDGSLLILEENMIKAFMIDSNLIKREKHTYWRQAVLIPNGFWAKRDYYKVLNKNLEIENKELEDIIYQKDRIQIDSKQDIKQHLLRINSKLGKLVKDNIAGHINVKE